MEIEKKRETSWKIQLKGEDNKIQLTSVEISGEVRAIKLAVMNRGEKAQVEMNNEEFFNFLSLISAFKDVVIGETTFLEKEQLNLQINSDDKTNEMNYIETKPSKNQFESSQKEKLDPKEWDPW
ncbi:MAG: hypothetical protein BAJALOKI1v1_520016 [Promethearchaeota archaeon]|nr:MAG: hypothetical protein BAJALOKI1v1_520016 [Candidatus Lokiarchaeota archaeon]